MRLITLALLLAGTAAAAEPLSNTLRPAMRPVDGMFDDGDVPEHEIPAFRPVLRPGGSIAVQAEAATQVTAPAGLRPSRM
ncbi:MAG: hypothetical protein KKC72_02905 [Alphaproteobacteria bacterium]|nr:hypothetical protein [Alphaproteobacteria bacterium]